MKLSQILSQVKTTYTLSAVINIDLIAVDSIEIDSRLVKKNSVFFALPGKLQNGSGFIDSAIKNGASLIISDSLSANANASYLTTNNLSDLLVEFLKIFYSPLPANIYAITGTNGKTSVAEFTRQILQFLGKKSASIGTLGVTCESVAAEQFRNSSLTTPDIVSLYKNLYILKKNSVDDVAIEVSSIGLEQGRAAGLEFAVGSFTNFTQDHLDYHKSMAEYFRCKALIFDQAKCAVLNSDITEFENLKKICAQKKLPIIDYGYQASDLKLCPDNVFEFRGKKYHFELAVSGEFQVFNMLCALGNVLSGYDLSEEDLQNLLKNFGKLETAAGRMQLAATLSNKARIYIDFAHTPDALTNVLQLARQITKSRVCILFGCGGDRDAKKRPLMGKIACELADLVIVTDDNPRTEKAEIIRSEILAACDMQKTIEVADRKAAIVKAISILEAEDTLILAGKGHEKYQIIGAKKLPFDEEEIVRKITS